MTLPRVLEPAARDTAEQARDYDAMDHSETNRAFVADLLAAESAPGDVLDLMAGTAQIPVVLCEQCGDCRVMAADWSVYMLDLARYNIEIAGLIDRIQLDHIDARKLLYPDGYFTTVISNGALHHIAAPLEVLREAVRVLAPGGLIFFRDLLRPESDADVDALVRAYAGEENERQQSMFEASLRAALTLSEVQALVEQLGFAADEATATSDRHWTWCSRKPQPAAA